MEWHYKGIQILVIFHAKDQIESTSRLAPTDIKTLNGLKLGDKFFSNVSLLFPRCDRFSLRITLVCHYKSFTSIEDVVVCFQAGRPVSASKSSPSLEDLCTFMEQGHSSRRTPPRRAECRMAKVLRTLLLRKPGKLVHMYGRLVLDNISVFDEAVTRLAGNLITIWTKSCHLSRSLGRLL